MVMKQPALQNVIVGVGEVPGRGTWQGAKAGLHPKQNMKHYKLFYVVKASEERG